MNNEQQTKNPSRKRLSDFLFILWAGGAALLSYSLVYALRKPYTAAAFEDVEFFDMDYKVVVTISQIVGYVISKFMGIKLISELRREERLRFILMSVVMAELSLVFFGLLSAPYNIAAMFLNGLSLGCMWGVIFSFIEGRRMTDILASLLGVSMVISSGTAKSAGLYVMNNLHVNEFWMPALIGAVALPQLALLGYALNRLPQPTEEDIAMKSERATLNGKQRWELFKNFMPFLMMLFVANIAIVVLRDIKEDFLVNIIDVSKYSPWLFAKIDSVVTLIILVVFGLMVFVKDNLKALHPFRIDYYGDGRDVCYLFRAGTVPAFSRCLAVHPESLPVYRISYFPDSFLRPVHCLFQDSWECRVLYCDDGLFRIYRDSAGARVEGILQPAY